MKRYNYTSESLRFAVKSMVVTMFVLAFGSMANAQSRQFKDTWVKLMSPVYFKAQVVNNKMPDGDASFKIFGFKNNEEMAADFDVTGKVVYQEKKNKEFTFLIDDADLQMSNSSCDIQFNGKLVMDINYSKETKKINILFIFSEGTLNYKGVSYHIKEAFSSAYGMVKVVVDEEYKYKPSIVIMTDELNLPKYTTKSAKPSPDVIQRIQSGQITLRPDDQAFFNSVVAETDRITDLPEYKEVVCKLYDPKDITQVLDSEITTHLLGDIITMGNVKAVRKDGNVNVYISGDGRDACKAEYDDKLYKEFKKVNWDNGCSYANEIITRDDMSRLSGVKFDKDAYNNKRGYITEQLRVLSILTDSEIFEFADIVNNGNVEVQAYFAPDTESAELIIDNTIPSVAQRVAAEREAERLRREEHERMVREAYEALANYKTELEAEYDKYSGGVVVFTVTNSQAVMPYQMKVARYIERDYSTGDYREVYKLNDNNVERILRIDDDGDLYFDGDYRRYYLTRLTEPAKSDLSKWRAYYNMRKLVDGETAK